ncbi:MAG TPA: M20 family metallopeptidase [Bryobacteraceae bacterium]|nr:M20 family metallopeptidase [Bryobacteraceae bacterium]
MDPILSLAQKKQKELITFLKELVECESPSDDPASIERFVELFTARTSDITKAKVIKGRDGFGPHLQCEMLLDGPKRRDGQVLALGHSDTVYPLGTLAKMPFRQRDGSLYGPGVYDMKGGVAFFVYAMRILRDLEIPVRRRVLLQLVSDEEVGSVTSRALTESEARKSIAVLVLEPGQGLDGHAKTARKGIGDYTVTVHGRSAHAGVDPQAGASAVVELARQIEVIAGFTNFEQGVTVNPGVVRGGTRSNVIADFAQAEVDIRVPNLRHFTALDKKFRKLRAFDKRCRVEVEGGLNRPPMERTKGVVALYKQARSLAAKLGVDLQESATGGGSDGNFTAALGVPTLDGLGAVGEGAHSPGERVLVDRIADRVALLAHLVAAI